jgi:hypothetical protein
MTQLQNHHLIPQELLPGGSDAHPIFNTVGDLFDPNSREASQTLCRPGRSCAPRVHPVGRMYEEALR